jgi:hypothetical protein
MSSSHVIDIAKKYYPEAVTSKLISDESGISRGTILRTISRMRDNPNMYDELSIYEESCSSGKATIKILYRGYKI